MTLPAMPVKGPEEAAALFDARMLNWWRECDITIRAEQAARCEQWQASVVPVLQPTLDKLADAWGAFDARLGDLAAALAGGGTSAGPVEGLSESFVLGVLRLVLNKPEPT